MGADGRLLGSGCLGSATAYDESTIEYKEQMTQHWDDITGRQLNANANKVADARQEEMAEFRKTAFTPK
jgi:hypothetical protein